MPEWYQLVSYPKSFSPPVVQGGETAAGFLLRRHPCALPVVPCEAVDEDCNEGGA